MGDKAENTHEESPIEVTEVEATGCELMIDMPMGYFERFVDLGREVANNQDYARIGIRHLLSEAVENDWEPENGRTS